MLTCHLNTCFILTFHLPENNFDIANNIFAWDVDPDTCTWCITKVLIK